jgi:CHAT domain-containing protein
MYEYGVAQFVMADHDNVFQALTSGTYHIVHYVGHAIFDAQTPYKSALVLHNRDLSTGPLARMLSRNLRCCAS